MGLSAGQRRNASGTDAERLLLNPQPQTGVPTSIPTLNQCNNSCIKELWQSIGWHSDSFPSFIHHVLNILLYWSSVIFWFSRKTEVLLAVSPNHHKPNPSLCFPEPSDGDLHGCLPPLPPEHSGGHPVSAPYLDRRHRRHLGVPGDCGLVLLLCEFLIMVINNSTHGNHLFLSEELGSGGNVGLVMEQLGQWKSSSWLRKTWLGLPVSPTFPPVLSRFCPPPPHVWSFPLGNVRNPVTYTPTQFLYLAVPLQTVDYSRLIMESTNLKQWL